ncbi:MAG: Ni/Fe hydrogenase subunit alpha [Nanobdellota archaeon]
MSRLEGHGKITLHLDDHGELTDARFHVIEFRGFEKFLQGRKVWEAPRITTRACGICPISHHLASAKATDDLHNIEIPYTAKLYRELHHMAQTIHSHALHFFFLASPDFLFPDDAAKRNVLGILEANPNLAKQAIELRRMGQEINHILGGKAIHPVTSIPGGISKGIQPDELQKIQENLNRALELAKTALKVGGMIFDKNHNFVTKFATFPSYYMGLVKDGNLELYDGDLRVVDKDGNKVEEFNPKEYLDHISERTENWSWLKFPYLKKFGWPDGIYRVNSLARLNVCDQIATPMANEELQKFRAKYGRAPGNTLLFNFARLIELVYAIERGLEITKDPEITGTDTRKIVKIASGEGIGVIEAPRGTLIHHYKADDTGSLTMANMIVSTVQNNPSMNLAVMHAARQFITGGTEITEPLMNRIEMAVRAYDPCLSCATHAVGKMPLHIQVYGPRGELFKEKKVK